MRKIAFDYTALFTPQPSGIPRYTNNLLEALLIHYPQNHYLLWGVDPKNQKWPANITFMKPYLIQSANFQVDQFLSLMCRMYEADVMLRMWGAAPIKRTCPGVTMLFDIIPLLFPEWSLNPKNVHLFKNELPKTLPFSDAVLTTSENSRNDILNNYPFLKDRVFVTRPGVNSDFFNTKKESDYITINNQVIKENYILGVGSLEPRKNLARLVAAFNIFRDRNPKLKTKLILHGTPWHNNETSKNFIYQSPYRSDILHTGFLEEKALKQVYAHASVFAYPSLYEGFGLPILEAMAVGIPVITANNSSLVEAGGNAAFYCDAQNIESITSGIEHFLINEEARKDAINKGKAHAKSFTWQKTASETMAVLNQILN